MQCQLLLELKESKLLYYSGQLVKYDIRHVDDIFNIIVFALHPLKIVELCPQWRCADDSHSESESDYNYQYQLHCEPLNSDPCGAKKSAGIKRCSNLVYQELRAFYANPTETSSQLTLYFFMVSPEWLIRSSYEC